VEAFKGGAVDFLIKPAQEGELLRAIKIAAKRDSDRLHNLAIARRFETLTRREKEVLALVVRGASIQRHRCRSGDRINDRQSTSRASVKKMGAKNVADLVRMTRKILW
jgi:FixJ family two-component response regulator